MTYATADDMAARYGSEELAVFGAESVQAALADATSEMDGYLGARYSLPLAPMSSSPLIVRLCCTIARALLYDHDPPEQAAENAKYARAVLGKLADGSMILPGAGPAGAPLASPELGERTGPDPVMTADALEGL